jgi:hypothetical protein
VKLAKFEKESEKNFFKKETQTPSSPSPFFFQA